ncbi:1-(5-phosphoribosyl)-5-((5-phosphoribosylamino)methylideneamino)imidazole-4-carboxamide isomerase [Macrococcus sp. EM39E]|uniref:1-(5-phosphoribosyl)-5-((5- phosphoribosylamino)methylideneamino)imidazole-4- carboxamide isomerase n=1 Tax=Macrococcus animalis TaxID=3395467 RepID=UPI0039BE451B
MIEIWPAIDIIDGQNVRLTEGNYGTKEQMKRTPEEAIAFYATHPQVKRIHIIDLIGAKQESPAEQNTIQQLIEISTLPVEIGGGIRTLETVLYYFNIGADYLIIGTKGLTDLAWLKSITLEFPGRIYLAVDAFKEDIALNGWLETSKLTVTEMINTINDYPLGGVIYTDITKDGKLNGPNFEITEKLVQISKLPIIASGGVRNAQDIKKLEAIGAHAAIVGKACNNDAFWEGLND